MRKYEKAGIAVDQVLLPKEGTDWGKWAVVACDQYTSEPEYWEQVDGIVGDSPSTLRLIYPEVYLGEDAPERRIEAIRQKMEEYVDQGTITPRDGMVYLERAIEGKTRRGIVLCVDLDCYDFTKGSESLIRATEGTIVERLPPRVKIRKGARLELPHIMVLVDDPDNTVIGQLTAARDQLTKLYDFDLMMKSGHLGGYLVDDQGLEKKVVAALEALADPATFQQKYGFAEPRPVLLYAMGDGNHSLATAKAIWEETKGEIRYRVRDPKDFRPDTFRRKALDGVDGVSIIVAKLKPEHVPEGGDPESMVIQAYRFARKTDDSPDGWTMDRAKE